jgi:O-acetyl-ADP-ribose deacetylase (regulator of RNase III)
MIHRNGSLFESDAGYLAHGVNCEGVMGAGIATLFRARFPYMYAQYKADCEAGIVKPGNYDVVRADFNGREVMVVNLATQDKPGANASYEWLAEAIVPFANRAMAPENVARHGKVVAIPEIGCGIGGLEWPVVEEILIATEMLTGIEFEVWHYAG